MAKRGRKAKNKMLDDLPAGLRGKIDQAITSDADESVRSIFDRFGLAQRGLVLATFYRDVRRRRLQVAAYDAPVSRASDTPSWEDIDRAARRLALERLNAGDGKIYELALLSRSRREADRLEIDKKIEARAKELHEIKMEELLKDQSAALDNVAKAANLTPEQVAEIRLRVLGTS